MEFGIPPRNAEVANFPLAKVPPPLRADGNLDYPKFITLVKNLWAEAHPEIPIRPVESSKYSKYPCIIYSLLSRSPVTNESKPKLREVRYDDPTHNKLIFGQRFNNVISFTVVTENNPELAEAVIETFESFMLEYTEVFKRLGVSEFLYARRLPDDEVTRPDEDIVKRAVAYMVTLERVLVREVNVIEQITVKAQVMLQNYWQGMEFWVFDKTNPDGQEQYLWAPGHPFMDNDLIKLVTAGDFQDETANGDAEFNIQKVLPTGLHSNYIYQVYAVTEDQIFIQYLNGSPVTILSSGMGRITGVQDTSAYVKAQYIDEFQTKYSSATPSY